MRRYLQATREFSPCQFPFACPPIAQGVDERQQFIQLFILEGGQRHVLVKRRKTVAPHPPFGVGPNRRGFASGRNRFA